MFPVSGTSSLQPCMSTEISASVPVTNDAEWLKWQNATDQDTGELREIAVARMKQCQKNKKFALDFRNLFLTSLPPHIPENSRLLVDEKFLNDIIKLAIADGAAEKNISDCIENILDFHFVKESQSVVQDNSDYIREDIYVGMGLHLYIDDSNDLYEDIQDEFNDQQALLRDKAYQHLFDYFQLKEYSEEVDIDKLKSVLVVYLEGEFINLADKYAENLKAELEC